LNGDSTVHTSRSRLDGCFALISGRSVESLELPRSARCGHAPPAESGVQIASLFSPTWYSRAGRSYVTLVGPRSTSILVGWDGQKKYWADSNKRFSQRISVLSDQHIHVNGNLAWEMGQEGGENKMKDGSTSKNDWIVTNVYEKQADGRWLIVSHHVQPKPQ
jgi:ketosteroid isomerase-like protein